MTTTATTAAGGAGAADGGRGSQGGAGVGGAAESPLLADLISACVLGVGCDAGVPVRHSVGACVEYLIGDLIGRDRRLLNGIPRSADHILACAKAATSCDAFTTCVHPGYDDAYCADNPGDSCDGATVVIGCDDGPPSHVGTCPAGTLCGPETVVGPLCESMVACSLGDPDYCDGGHAYTCWNTVMTAYICQGDLECELIESPNQSSVARCFPPTKCSVEGGVCDGDTAVVCEDWRESGLDPILRQRRLDCSAANRGCVDGACVVNGSACDPEQFEEECLGNELRVCADGEIVQVDCAAYGFSGCTERRCR